VISFSRPSSTWVAQVGIYLAVVLTASGCYRQKNRASVPAPIAVPAPEDRVGVDDVFEVRVFGEQELSGIYRISAEGTIDFPLAGRLKVAGMRCEEIQETIVSKLKGGYLKDPQVSVMIKTWNSRKVTVLGQVQKPGSVDYFPNMTLVDAIALAGGFTPIAEKNAVNLRREVSGKVETMVYRLADISEGRSPNVIILPGDVVVVEERLF
jgi:protein involved in polysaccharide export with SLBB domain